MKQCIAIASDGTWRHLDDVRAISDVLGESETLIWLDLSAPKPEDFTLIQREFGLHPLAIEDAIKAHQRAKIEAYANSWFIIAQAATRADSELVFHEVAIFAGENFVITVRADPQYPLDEIERRWQQLPPAQRNKSGTLLYTILDAIVDGYSPLAEDIEEQVAELEELLVGSETRTSDVLIRIFEMKKQLHLFQRSIMPMRDVLSPILRGDLAIFSEHEIPYFRDINDHIVRVAEQILAVSDSLNSARETQIALASHRQNEVTKQLTIVATIFLPLTFITGFFGQNFSWLTEHITGKYSFAWLGIGVELLAVLMLVGYFKYKRYF